MTPGRKDPQVPHASADMGRRTLIERLADVLPAAAAERFQQSAPRPASPAPPVSDRPATQRPKTEPAVRQIDLQKLHKNGLLVPGSTPSPMSEAFRILKRHVLLRAFGSRTTAAQDRGRVVVLSSPLANEGKTYCALNLALSLTGERGLEVLLVDADCIKPEVLSRLGVGASRGLMDALASGTPPEAEIVPTSIPNLLLLPAGARTHDDAELLGSAEMQGFIQRQLAAHPNRILVFDTAPALVAASSPVLASHAGQVILVVRADFTQADQLAAAMRLFPTDTSLQLLLNRASFQASRQRYGAYYGYRS